MYFVSINFIIIILLLKEIEKIVSYVISMTKSALKIAMLLFGLSHLVYV